MDTREPRHRDPIVFDTLVLLAIQSGFYVLSRRFLLHALPTLRNISKQGTEPDGTGSQDESYRMRSFRERNDGNGDEDGAYTEEEGDGLLNASGGYSDIEASSSTPRNPASRQRWKGGVESDSDDDMSEATRSYAGSPLPSPGLELGGPNGGASTVSLIKQEAGLANFSKEVNDAESRGHARRISAMNGLQLPAIRTPGTPSSPSTPTFGSSVGGPQSRKQELQVLRVFKPRELNAGTRAGVGGKEKEKVGATRGLGFLAR